MEQERYCRWCQQELKRRRVNWFGQYVDIGGELLHFVEKGAGEPLVLIHGFLCWSYSWRHNIPALAERCRVLAPDLRGFGLSERSGQRGHSLTDQVEVLRDFLDARCVSTAVLCGHSMGGEIAMRFALTYPERVQALVLVAGSGYVHRQQRGLERLVLGLPGVANLFVRATVMNRRFAARALREAYRAPDCCSAADMEAYLLPASAPGTDRSLVRMLRDMDFGATAAQLSKIAHQTLLLWGQDDPWVPCSHGERLAKELSNSELVVLPDCGHAPQEEYPEAFNQTVLDFLARLPQERACPN